MSLCRAELAYKSTLLTIVFFTALLLGLLTSWIGNADDYGKEHHIGARAFLNVLSAQDQMAWDP